jgi:hypothetical protein
MFSYVAPVFWIFLHSSGAHAGVGFFSLLISPLTGSVFSSFSAPAKAAGVLCSDFIFPAA